MAIIGIVAVAKNYAIGKHGKLPWHYSADLKFFKRITKKNAVVMGVRTWESIGKRLPDRLNIVLSRNQKIETKPGFIHLKDKEEVIAVSKFLNCDLYIIGGAKTYNSFARIIKKWIITEIPLEIRNADAFMPKDFLNGFELSEIENLNDGLMVKIYEKAL